MKRAALSPLCLPVLLVLGSGPLHAQSPPERAERDTVYPMPRVEVIGKRWNLSRIAGSASILDARTLETSRVFTANEALRKLPGLVVRDEEGFGLRPNIGIRGL